MSENQPQKCEFNSTDLVVRLDMSLVGDVLAIDPAVKAIMEIVAQMTCGKGSHFLCGAVWLPGNFLVALPGALQGSQCAASVTLPLPIPADTALCGLKFCLQGMIDCSNGSGYGLTEAIQFSVAG